MKEINWDVKLVKVEVKFLMFTKEIISYFKKFTANFSD